MNPVSFCREWWKFQLVFALILSINFRVAQDCDAKPYPGLNLPHQGWQCFFPPQTTNIEDVFPVENWWIFHVMLVFRRYVHPYLGKMNPFCLQQYCSTRVELEPPPVRAVSPSSMESFQVLSRQLKRWHLFERRCFQWNGVIDLQKLGRLEEPNMTKLAIDLLSGGNSNIFGMFTPYLGKMIQFWRKKVQRGLVQPPTRFVFLLAPVFLPRLLSQTFLIHPWVSMTGWKISMFKEEIHFRRVHFPTKQVI